jgi:hypothetical protein
MDYGFVEEIKTLVEKNASWDNDLKRSHEKVNKRKEEDKGKIYSLNEHMEAVIYALLSNQRPWKCIDENRSTIDKIFFDYDVEKIKNTEASYFINSLKKIRCGNRNINKQMNGLKDIINVLDKIKKKYGEIDNYFNNHPKVKAGYPYYLAKELANIKNEYKLKNMGVALVCEYFGNIGIDTAKPDTHIRRMLGKNILGVSKNEEATPEEAIKYIKEIADEKGIFQKEVDVLLWGYCADGYGEICTKDNPKCDMCVIKNYCNKNKANVA